MRPQPTSGAEWSYRDLLWTLTLGFAALAALAISNVKPTEAGHKEPAKMIITLRWDAASDADVDLWISSPGDKPVGFTRRTGTAVDLRHDHRGFRVEHDHDNYEVADARKLPAGLWSITAVAFNAWDKHYPIHVWVVVERIDDKTGVASKMFRAEGDLTEPEQEITLLNFRLDDAGNVVPGSDNNNQVCLFRSACP